MYFGTQTLIPFRISNNQNFEINLDLLLLTDGSMHHYVLIKNIKGLIDQYIQKKTAFRQPFVSKLFSY